MQLPKIFQTACFIQSGGFLAYKKYFNSSFFFYSLKLFYHSVQMKVTKLDV